MRVAFIGPPGSGKGTYSQMLAKKGWVHFSMGQVLREHAAANGKFAKKIRAFQSAGKLVPSSIFFSVFEWFMQRHKNKKIIFDGLPRNLVQAKAMEKVLSKHKTPFDAFIFLDVKEKELERRLLSRRQCEKCGKVYGPSFPPKKKGTCDVEGAPLIRRNDDNPSTIRTRFNVYEKETLPVVDWAAQHHLVFFINANADPSAVFKRISSSISFIAKWK